MNDQIPSAVPSGARVVAIVLNRNRSDLLGECLLRLQGQSHPPAAVILVDDASTDDSIRTAKKMWPGVRVVEMPEPSGVIAARNAGLACAMRDVAADFLCFLDNDAFLAPTALAEMVAAAQDPAIGMVTPKAFRSTATRCLASAGGMTVNLYLGVFRDVGTGETDVGQYDAPADVSACAGFAFLLRAEAARRAGDFDAGLKRYGWEDVDYSLRVAGMGYRLRYAPKAEVEHRGGHAGRGVVAAYEYWKIRNLFILMRRHAGPLQWACFLTVLPPRCVFAILRLLWAKTGGQTFVMQLRRLRARFGAP